MEKELKEKLEKELENQIGTIVEDGFGYENLDMLGKLVDIHKDLANEEYWKEKKEAMQMNYRGYEGEYGNYGNYGRESYGRRRRDSRGRYMERGGSRGGSRGGNYRGEETLEEMQEHYQRYSDGREEMTMGNYGAHSTTMKSLEYMLESVVEFIEMLKKDANSQEEVELIQKYTREISEM